MIIIIIGGGGHRIEKIGNYWCRWNPLTAKINGKNDALCIWIYELHWMKFLSCMQPMLCIFPEPQLHNISSLIEVVNTDDVVLRLKLYWVPL